MKSIVLNPICSDSQHDNCERMANGNQIMITDSYIKAPFDVYYYREWFANNWYLSIYMSVIYIICISYGQKWIKNRKPYNLKNLIAIWNLSLSCFSLFGSIKMIPELVSVVIQKGFYHSVCNNSYADDVSIEYWIWLFTWSKLIEFGDTVFIVLRKQKLIFLHWIHHVITLIYCFFVYSETPATSRWGITINYAIHAIMYFYYALKVLKFSVPKNISMTITILQTIQMFVGIITGSGALLFILTGYSCDGTVSTALATFSMSSFYFILFSKFFVKRYFLVQANILFSTRM